MLDISIKNKFIDVFKNIPLNNDIKNTFKNAEVKKLKISKETQKIEIDILLKELINESFIGDLQSEIKKQSPFISDVLVNIRYELDNIADSTKKIQMYWETVIHTINKNSPFCSGMMQSSHWQIYDNKLIICVKNNYDYFLKKRLLDKQIEKQINDRLGLDFIVEFIPESKEFDNENYIQNILKKEEKLVKQLMESTLVPEKFEIQKADGEKRVITVGSVLLGKPIQGNISKIISTKTEGEEVIVEGQVLSLTEREIKGEKYIVSFDITDYTDSTTVKFFIKKDKYENEVKETLKVNMFLKVKGTIQFDKYSNELNLMVKDIMLSQKPAERMDHAEVKRVELHLHTQMSMMDAINSIDEYIKRAAAWGHKAIALTDHGVVQAYPEAMSASKKHGVKLIYGVEAYLVDDLGSVVESPENQTFDDEFVVFDIETTGLSNETDRIIEIGAVKICNGVIVDKFNCFVDPMVKLPTKIIELTGIKDEDLVGAEKIDTVLPQFLEFVSDSMLVAHNASFDVGFIRSAALRVGIEVKNTVIDTVELSRALFPMLSKHKLNIVAEHLGVSLENHHRAVDDALATAEIFIKCIELLKENNVNDINGINIFASKSANIKKLKTYHAIILVKNQTGLRNLYELISKSHIEYFQRRPRIPKSEFLKLREGLIIGSACEAGELYRALLDKKSKEYIKSLVYFYDYMEIQPLGNNQFLIDKGTLQSAEDLKNLNREIVSLGEKYNKPVVATCDVHFLDPDDEVFRRIIMAGSGFDDADKQPPLFFRTTEEMLSEFSYLGEKKCFEVVVTNTNLIADMVESVKPIPDETFPPKIEGAEDLIRDITMEKVTSIYGDNLHQIVKERLDKELNSIIKNGFSVMYIIAQKLVWNSLENGYLVGSRGSVGSSFVATMAGITEVNPLPPHYICPSCKYSDFESDVVVSFSGGSGCDMPDKNCPVCGTLLKKEGHDIPFETFLGFDGDKEPDIDLNFSGEYQQHAHAYTEELFGEGHVFKAGTIGTLAEKTAFGYVKKYIDERGKILHNAEISRLISGCTGIKRTTGQHPGGLMIVPSDHSIYEFCPIQRPANDVNSNVVTTHFDYHSISGRLLKLDILGHDDPTVIRMLHDLTGSNPQDVPLDDKKTMSLFTSPEALGISTSDINCETGSLGLPEFGTKFVRQMLVDTQPNTFAELVRIAGLSHGTDVWLNNAQELVKDGTAKLKEVISTRDDIMVYLIIQGVEKKQAFKIMENVRKGKGLQDSEVEVMKAAGVPDWYIDSCKKIKYMFPKAHAAAYVMMSFRIAYFKVYYPKSFYASYFSIRAEDFDYELMCRGRGVVQSAIKELEERGNTLTTKEKGTLTILEIVNEMYARGINFLPIDLYKSDSRRFLLDGDFILPPLNSMQGLGSSAAQNIVTTREFGEFHSIEDFRIRTKVSKTVIELLKNNHILKGIPETNQLSLF